MINRITTAVSKINGEHMLFFVMGVMGLGCLFAIVG